VKFTTVSGSLYEVDATNKRIRRLSGNKPPTERQGNDWKQYDSISAIEVGQPVLIIWNEGTPLLPDSPEGALPTTMTSFVQSIEEAP
jgi:hypothetical protein